MSGSWGLCLIQAFSDFSPCPDTITDIVRIDRKPRGLYCLLHTFGKHLHIFPCFEVLFTTEVFIRSPLYQALEFSSSARSKRCCSVLLFNRNTSSHRFTLFLKCIYLRYIIYWLMMCQAFATHMIYQQETHPLSSYFTSLIQINLKLHSKSPNAMDCNYLSRDVNLLHYRVTRLLSNNTPGVKKSELLKSLLWLISLFDKVLKEEGY